MSQIQEMIKPAAAMLDTYPVVTTKQKIKQWIKTCIPGMTPEKAAAMLRSALELANRAVYEQSQLSDDFTGMGTTLVAALVRGLRVEIDGRLYDGTIKKQLTITDGNEEVDSSSEAGFEWLEKLGVSDKKSGGISEEELNEQGIYKNTIRLSIGTENIDDIIEDLEGGFQSV